MVDFLEERLLAVVRYGSSYQDDYNVKIVPTSGGNEYRTLIHPYPVRRFDVSYILDNAALWDNLLAVYHRAHGKYAGFRVRCDDEYSSAGEVDTPTAFDQPMLAIAAGATYQLIKRYGTDKTAGAAGYATRLIKKPVAGTVFVGIGSTVIRSVDWSVDTTTGVVTFAADISKAITGISKAANAVISFGATHSFIAGMSVQISGVLGMLEINGLRALIVSTGTNDITVAINSTAFSTWASGGVVHTRPQMGEAVTAGFQFDFPARFDSSIPVGQDNPGFRSVDSVQLVELLNP